MILIWPGRIEKGAVRRREAAPVSRARRRRKGSSIDRKDGEGCRKIIEDLASITERY